MNSNDALILKQIRTLRGLSLKEASLLLGCSISTIKRREREKNTFSQQEIESILNAYGVCKTDFVNLKLDKPVQFKIPKKSKKIIENPKLRRSYKKIITPEVNALIHLRKRLGITKHKACKLCGFNRSAVGSIENGRITLTTNKIKHIVKRYGFKMKDFQDLLHADVDRVELENTCIKKIQALPNQKLEMLLHLIKGL